MYNSLINQDSDKFILPCSMQTYGSVLVGFKLEKPLPQKTSQNSLTFCNSTRKCRTCQWYKKLFEILMFEYLYVTYGNTAGWVGFIH